MERADDALEPDDASGDYRPGTSVFDENWQLFGFAPATTRSTAIYRAAQPKANGDGDPLTGPGNGQISGVRADRAWEVAIPGRPEASTIGIPDAVIAILDTGIVWQDAIMNWAPYAVYNPQLWHWPETWGLVSLSPTVEPFIVVGYVAFYLAPFFPAVWILRRLQRRRPVDSFVWRHPLISLAVLIYVVGFVYDAVQEILLVRSQLYIYSQVIPFGSVFTGKPYQFPLLWESTLVTTVMIPAGVLLYRDDTGRTVAEKLAQRIRGFRGRPALGTFAVMFAILNASYLFLYGGSFAVIRASGAATSVACPYPFPEAKVYDPQGYYEKAGQPGPYSAGIWDGWQTGQSGRPQVHAPSSGRCSPQSG